MEIQNANNEHEGGEPKPFGECPLCDSTGFRMVGRTAVSCDCRKRGLQAARIAALNLPEGLHNLTLSTLRRNIRPISRSIETAIKIADDYIRTFERARPSDGLLLIGPLDVGSRVAAAVLYELCSRFGLSGRYYEWVNLLRDYVAAQRDENLENELSIYRATEQPDVVVFNGIGSKRPSESEWDRIGMLLNSRYCNALPSIMTTVYWNQAAHDGSQGLSYAGRYAKRIYLGDQIGERARSRLNEICKPVQFWRTDPVPLQEFYRFVEDAAKRIGPRTPVLIEIEKGSYAYIREICFDELGNVYFQREPTGVDLHDALGVFRAIKKHLDWRNLEMPLAETAIYLQCGRQLRNDLAHYLVASSCYIEKRNILSDGQWFKGPTIVLSPRLGGSANERTIDL